MFFFSNPCIWDFPVPIRYIKTPHVKGFLSKKWKFRENFFQQNFGKKNNFSKNTASVIPQALGFGCKLPHMKRVKRDTGYIVYHKGIIHLRRRQIFMIFYSYLPPVGNHQYSSKLHTHPPSIGKCWQMSGKGKTPSPRHADIVNGWSLI